MVWAFRQIGTAAAACSALALAHWLVHMYFSHSTTFKETVAWDFWSWFFHQTTPLGPRLPSAIYNFGDFLRSYSSFKTTSWHLRHQGVMISRCPRWREIENLRCPGHQGIKNLQSPGHWGFLFLLFFKLQAIFSSSGTPEICESPVSRTLGIHESPMSGAPGSWEALVSRTPGSQESPVSWTPGSCLLSVGCFFQTLTHCYSL